MRAPTTTMSIYTAYEKLLPLRGKSLRDCLSQTEIDWLADHHRDKGALGKTFEHTLGLPWSSRLLDFIDGDLKTTKTDAHGCPVERLVITQANFVKEIFDSGDEPVEFWDTHLFAKMSHMLIVGVCRDDPDPLNWVVTVVQLVNLDDPELQFFAYECANAYDRACDEMLARVQNGECITGTGKKRKDAVIKVCQRDNGGSRNRPLVSERYGLISPMHRAWCIPANQLARLLSYMGGKSIHSYIDLEDECGIHNPVDGFTQKTSEESRRWSSWGWALGA